MTELILMGWVAIPMTLATVAAAVHITHTKR